MLQQAPEDWLQWPEPMQMLQSWCLWLCRPRPRASKLQNPEAAPGMQESKEAGHRTGVGGVDQAEGPGAQGGQGLTLASGASSSKMLVFQSSPTSPLRARAAGMELMGPCFPLHPGVPHLLVLLPAPPPTAALACGPLMP